MSLKKDNKQSIKTQVTRLVSKLYFSHFKKKVLNLLILSKKFKKKIIIKVVQNNIFCSLICLKNKKTLHTSSAGIYKIKISRRKFKKVYQTFLNAFFYKIKKYTVNLNNFIFSIIAPLNIRRKIFNIIKGHIAVFNTNDLSDKNTALPEFSTEAAQYRNILVFVPPKKCFNGCRAQKRIRKKRRLYRIFKS